MRIEQLQYIVEISKTHSLSQAAKNLYMTQPSLSFAVSNLEEELGKQIFHRSNAGAFPTEEGLVIIEIAKKALYEIEQLTHIDKYEQEQKKNIRLVTFPILESTIILDVSLEMKKQYNDIFLNIRTCRPEQVPSFIQDNLSYIGIGGFSTNKYAQLSKMLNSSNMIAEKLYDDRMVCLVSKSHPLAKQTETTMAEMKQYLHASFSELYDNYDRLEHYPHADFVRIAEQWQFRSNDKCFGVASLSSLIHAVSSGMVVAMIPEVALYYHQVAEAQLVGLPIVGIERTFGHYLIYRNKYQFSSLEQEFITKTKEKYQNLRF